MASAKYKLDILKLNEPLSNQENNNIHSFLEAHFVSTSGNLINQKQLPTFRYLAYSKKELLGHVAVHYRKIAVDQKPCNALCLSDFCIHTAFRGQKIGELLLEKLAILGTEHHIPFLLAITEVPDFYKKCGFEEASLTCQWLFTKNNQTMGVINRKFNGGLVIKKLGDLAIPEKHLDLMGTIF